MKKILFLLVLILVLAAGCGSAESLNNPYYVLFEKLFNDNPGLSSNIQYIAVDLSEDDGDFLTRMQAFCEQEGFTLLEDTIDGLTEKGYIKDLYFEDGVVISFQDMSRTDRKLVTEAMIWRAGLGATGGEYTLENKEGLWTITATGPQWIS